jgi:hypothetical protein
LPFSDAWFEFKIRPVSGDRNPGVPTPTLQRAPARVSRSPISFATAARNAS